MLGTGGRTSWSISLLGVGALPDVQDVGSAFLIVSRSVTARPEAVSLVEAPPLMFDSNVHNHRPPGRAPLSGNQLTADPPAGERRFNVELVDPGVVENQHAGQCTVGFGEPELGQKDDSSGDPAPQSPRSCGPSSGSPGLRPYALGHRAGNRVDVVVGSSPEHEAHQTMIPHKASGRVSER